MINILRSVMQTVVPVLHVFLIILALLVPVVVAIVVIFDVVREPKEQSVGEALATWSSQHGYYAWGLTLFWGVLLAHLFTQP